MSHIFISYVREDQLLVDKLVSHLEAKGALIWLDRDAIKPGELWQMALKEAIQKGNFFIACFSQNSVKKTKNVMNQELRIAVGELQKMTHGAIWFIPVLLNHCDVPDWPIDSNTNLRDFQRVSLADDWDEGVMRIATITLDLEKKNVREEIDRKAHAVIDAERTLLGQKLCAREDQFFENSKAISAATGGALRGDANALNALHISSSASARHYLNAISPYERDVSFARENYDKSANYYMTRFGETYSPLSGLYDAFESERRLSESKIEARIKELTNQGLGFQLGCALVLLIIVSIIFIQSYFFK